MTIDQFIYKSLEEVDQTPQNSRTVFGQATKKSTLASFLRTASSRVVVDIHTHVYPPRYLDLLRSRSTLPRIRPGANSKEPERLIILPDEDKVQSTSSGRPIGPEYHDINVKLSFMKRHSIDISVIRYIAFNHADDLFGKPVARFSTFLN
jgi:hypothetical protein